MDHVELVEHPDDIADDHDDGSNTCGGEHSAGIGQNQEALGSKEKK